MNSCYNLLLVVCTYLYVYLTGCASSYNTSTSEGRQGRNLHNI